MKTECKKILAVLLCTVMLCGGLPVAGLAGVVDRLSVTAADVVVSTIQETITEQQSGSPKLTGLDRTLANTYGGSSNDRFVSVVATKDGGYAVAAEVSSSDGDYSGITGASVGKKGVVIKFDKDGKELWKQAFLGQKYGIKFYDIAELTDGSLVVVGDSSDTVIDGKTLEGSGEGLNGIIAKLSASGEKLWIKSVGGSHGEYFSTVAATPDGAFVVGGKVTSSDGFFAGLPDGLIHAVVMRLTSDGEPCWLWALSGKMHSIINDVAVNENGQIFAACNTKSSELIDTSGNKVSGIGNGGTDAVVIKLDKNGKFIWSQVFAGDAEDNIGGLVGTDDGGCVVAGNFAARSYTPSGTFSGCRYYGSTEGVVAKYSSDGKLAAPITLLSGSNAEIITGITAVEGGCIVSGYTGSDDLNIVSDCKLGENKGKTDAIVWLLDANRKDIKLASVGGSDRDEAYSLASNGTSVMMVGATMSSDGDFDGQTPVGAHGRFTSFMAAYNILSSGYVPEAEYTVNIRNFLASRTESYKTTLSFTAETENAPSGAGVHWFINGKDVGTGEKYKVEKAKKTYTVQTKLIDKSGGVLAESEIETVNIKSSFFAKLLYILRFIVGIKPPVIDQ